MKTLLFLRPSSSVCLGRKWRGFCSVPLQAGAKVAMTDAGASAHWPRGCTAPRLPTVVHKQEDAAHNGEPGHPYARTQAPSAGRGSPGPCEIAPGTAVPGLSEYRPLATDHRPLFSCSPRQKGGYCAMWAAAVAVEDREGYGGGLAMKRFFATSATAYAAAPCAAAPCAAAPCAAALCAAALIAGLVVSELAFAQQGPTQQQRGPIQGGRRRGGKGIPGRSRRRP